jgi:pyruvate dehydrogenase E1 component beta subunit
MVKIACQAADILASRNIEASVIDLRSSTPLDTATIVESIEETGHLVVVDEGSARCGLAADIAAVAATRAFHALEAPVRMVTPPHTPVPFAPNLEALYLPDSARIVTVVEQLLSS